VRASESLSCTCLHERDGHARAVVGLTCVCGSVLCRSTYAASKWDELTADMEREVEAEMQKLKVASPTKHQARAAYAHMSLLPNPSLTHALRLRVC
jgi:hypothetical protein